MSIASINTLAIGLLNANVVSTGMVSSTVMSSTVLALTALCGALMLWLAWRYKAGNWTWLLGICVALLANLLLPVSKKDAAHIYLLTKEQPLLNERLISNNEAESGDNVLLNIASAPADTFLLSTIDNKDVVVLDFRNKSAEEQVQALRPYRQVKAWTVMGNDFPAKDVLMFTPSHSPRPAALAMRTFDSVSDNQEQVPAIRWQSTHKYAESLTYPPIVPVHSLWTLSWRILRHQTENLALADGAKFELQLMDGNEQLLSRGTPIANGEVHISYRFSAQGHYNFQLRFLHAGQEIQRLPISVFVTQSDELDAHLNFASPSFEWRTLKRWLERSNIPYQSQVKTAKEFNRRDRFGTRVDGSTPLMLFDERSWLAQSKIEVQARVQQVRNGAIVIVVTDASIAEPNDLQASAYSMVPSNEYWRKQELRLFGSLAESLSFASTTQPWRIDSAKLGQGGFILVREKEWHRVGSSEPERYDQVMADAIGSLWRTTSPSLSGESEMLAPGKLSRLCVDNAFPSVLHLEQRNASGHLQVSTKDSKTLELMPSARAGQYCANMVFEHSGWFAIFIDYFSDPKRVVEAVKSTERIKLGEVFVPDKALTRLENSRHLAALSFFESDSEHSKPSRLEQSNPAWRAWAYFGLVLFLTILWWHDQKKSISGDYRKAD